MKVCVTGSFGGGDIGDDAMVFPHLRNLQELGVERKNIWLIGHKPDYMAKHFSHPKERCLPSDPFHPPADLIGKTDALLVTGGGTINTRDTHGYSVRRAYSLIMPFVRARVPVFVSGQTIGPLGVSTDHDALAKEIIESVDVLTVRDVGHSRKYIEKIGAQPKVFVETIDDAAWIAPHDNLPIELPEGKKAAVNVTVYTYDTDAKRAAVSTICHRLSCMGYTVLLVPHHGWDLEALRTLESVPNAKLIDTTGWYGAQTKLLFSKCNTVIAGRYHAVVFAMTAGVPCVGMAGNHYSWIKQNGFAKQIEMEEMIVAPESVTDADLILGMATVERTAEVATPEPTSFRYFRGWFEEIAKCSS